ncbi:PPM family protein phosphatase [Janthinobacterium sp. CG_23.3]|uniref:PP2C family protein-serine/threonine phosphatase n=1 Tax=unclassified Janthinobacterium TaxID=2610881 RepID=UPI000348DD26|nr:MULTISPECIES: protein phosphatase 2C domain-containing protein [unclassified Janthinobacterium]MEC5160225.1 serine/threonine protein phosphatase PrpC [Janthinobacterium sp. CG_S6]
MPLTDTLDFGPGLDVAARSCAGAGPPPLPENQDNLLLIDGNGRAAFLLDQRQQNRQVSGWPAGQVRIAVLDGMGGHGHGRQAAEAVVQGLLLVPACATLEQLAERLDALHQTLQARFAAMDGAQAKRPGTTLTLLELRPGQAPLLYHVGDSRLYEITARQATPLTIDHVPATTFALHGLLGEAEWWQQVHGEHRPQISQAFILGNAISDPQVLAGPLYALADANLPPFLRQLGDRRALTVRADALYLLASDGFWACARPDRWVARWPALLAGLDAAGALDALFDSFLDNPPAGLHVDNLSALALRFRPQRPARNLDETALPGEARPRAT